jgi:hypothetical protein
MVSTAKKRRLDELERWTFPQLDEPTYVLLTVRDFSLRDQVTQEPLQRESDDVTWCRVGRGAIVDRLSGESVEEMCSRALSMQSMERRRPALPGISVGVPTIMVGPAQFRRGFTEASASK